MRGLRTLPRLLPACSSEHVLQVCRLIGQAKRLQLMTSIRPGPSCHVSRVLLLVFQRLLTCLDFR
jgi:hypothetical protein